MKKQLVKGQRILIHAYKHNGKIYRCWEDAIVLEVNAKYIAIVNESVIVTEMNGRKWKTNEPAIWFFFKKSWYNVISMIKNNGIHYYCNMASPFMFDGRAIKYIDYDIDVRVFPDGVIKVLDLKEFSRNKINWEYSNNLQNIILETLEQLKSQIKFKTNVFSEKIIWKHWIYYKRNIKESLLN